MNKNKNNKVQQIDPVRLVRDFEEERISEIDYLKMINSFTDSAETKKSRKLKDMHLWMGILNKYVRDNETKMDEDCNHIIRPSLVK